MLTLLKLLGLCFITAVFVVSIIITLFLLSKSVYTIGYEDAEAACQEYQYKTGLILPSGDSKVIHLENPSFGHRDEFTQGIYIQSVQGVHTAQADN